MAIFKKRVKATQIRSSNEFDDALSQGKPVFVDFMKHGCPPCQTMDGIVNELADDFQGEATVIKANLQYVPDLFEKFKVRSTPTFILVTPRKGGLHQRWRQSGLVKKDQLSNQIQKAVAASST